MIAAIQAERLETPWRTWKSNVELQRRSKARPAKTLKKIQKWLSKLMSLKIKNFDLITRRSLFNGKPTSSSFWLEFKKTPTGSIESS